LLTKLNLFIDQKLKLKNIKVNLVV
jgi:hypothetical protein